MVLVVVFAFVMCWAPFFIVTLVNYFLQILTQANFFFWQTVLLLFGFSNSCMNPIIYAFMSRAFRRGFRGIIVCFCPCTKPCFNNKTKFVNPRRSVTIISSEPATEACRVGGGNPTGNKRRRAAPDRSSRWNNTQYSAVSETEGIDMARIPAGHTENGRPCDHNRSKMNEDSFTSAPASNWISNKLDNSTHENAQKSGNNTSSFTKSNETPFEDIILEEESLSNTAADPATDSNQNKPIRPT